MSSLHVDQACEPYIRRKALGHLKKGRIVLLAGGTGRPFFTTDSAAAQFGCELGCEVVLKASTIDGVYDGDPKENLRAVKFDKLTFQEALEKGLTVMDPTAFAICQNKNLPIIVFSASDLNNIGKIISGERIGTIISQSHKTLG